MTFKINTANIQTIPFIVFEDRFIYKLNYKLQT